MRYTTTLCNSSKSMRQALNYQSVGSKPSNGQGGPHRGSYSFQKDEYIGFFGPVVR